MTSSGSCEYAKNDRMCAISLSNPSRTLPSSAGVSERAIAIRKALIPISSPFCALIVATILSISSVISGLRGLFVWKQKATTVAPDSTFEALAFAAPSIHG
ncbi:hypothetical protein CAZ16_33935 [Pseudomonas aeruginosa]|nr:hypothetical protein CAZ16_33935 [Pseudomonas aeruginosa]OTI77506.1 hypothetical protein CAZ32_33895 [Pseudomonas aeruginosa]OTI87114.1 hypothetical protein CAZ21_33935 [Pseudomonas aeruginosa]OTI94442.1 hypothetical protein CAZ02_33915 [Pseudomonas aeruginosa]OTI98440.1 hypothetical protein CAZ12_34030 [Pseudomonas aeruginosa]